MYQTYSARTMARNLELLADSVRTCNLLFFDNVASICLSFGGWSTMRGKKSFIGIVCHWIDNDFQRNSALIGFVPEIERASSGSTKSSEKLSLLIGQFLDDLCLRDKLSFLLGDNHGVNMACCEQPALRQDNGPLVPFKKKDSFCR